LGGRDFPKEWEVCRQKGRKTGGKVSSLKRRTVRLPDAVFGIGTLLREKRKEEKKRGGSSEPRIREGCGRVLLQWQDAHKRGKNRLEKTGGGGRMEGKKKVDRTTLYKFHIKRVGKRRKR